MAAEAVPKSPRWARKPGRRGRRSRLDTGCQYVGSRSLHEAVLADLLSDGATPQEKTKQILAVAPIIKGQSLSQHAAAPQQQHQQQFISQAQRQPTDHSDLIDFSQSDSATAGAIPDRGSSLHHTAQNTAPLGLQEPLTPGAPLKRVDTATKELDEFVDAKP